VFELTIRNVTRLAAIAAIGGLLGVAVLSGWLFSQLRNAFGPGPAAPTTTAPAAHAGPATPSVAGTGSALDTAHALGAKPAPAHGAPAPADATPTTVGQRPESFPQLLVPVLTWAAIAVGVALLALAAVSAARAADHCRRARRRCRYEITPYRNDVATPQRVAQAFQGLQTTSSRRWWRRWLSGAATVTLEVTLVPDQGRAPVLVLAVVCEPEDAPAVDGALKVAYPDVRVGFKFHATAVPASDTPTWTRHIVRLKKRGEFVQRIAATDLTAAGRAPYEHQMIDTLLANLSAITHPVTIQIPLTPAPGWIDRRAKQEYMRAERKVKRQGLLDGPGLGASSPRNRSELEGAVSASHHALFYTDIRCASNEHRTALLAANALRQGVGEGTLRVREPRLLAALHARRVAAGTPRLLPAFKHGVISSVELAALFQLPSNRAKGVMVRRSNVLREPAAAEIERPRNPQDAFAEDECGPIALRPEDRRYGVALTGVPGSGKTTAMIGLFQRDARDPDTVLIGLDPKSDASRKMLSAVPPQRPVYFLDLARPQFGMSPLLMRASLEVIGDTVVESLRDINEEGAIMAASDRYLRSATYGACLLGDHYATMRSWFELWQLTWPERTGEDKRREVVALSEGNPDLAGLRAFYKTLLPAMLAEAKGQVVVRMDAPSNKLARLLGQPSLARMLHHPRQVTIDQIVDERAVLIVEGAMGEVGEENSLVMLKFILRMIHTALQRQQHKPRQERARFCVYLDEAHYLMGHVLEVMLSTGRDAGLEPTLAWQHSGQIADRRLASGLLTDLQTTLNFRCGDPEEAELIALRAMTAYTKRLTGEQAERDNARFTPDYLLNQPHAYMLGQCVVRGERSKPWVARYLPVTEDPARIDAHLAAQGDRGYYYPEDMPDLLDNLNHTRSRDIPDGSSAEEPEQPPQADQQPPVASTTASHTKPPAPQSATPVSPADPAPTPTPESAASAPPADTAAPARSRPAPRATAPAVTADNGPDANDPGRNDSRPLTPEDAKHPRPIAESFTELDLGDVRQITWDKPETNAPPPGQPPTWKPDEVEVLTMLHRFGPLMATQIARAVWPTKAERTWRRRLSVLYRFGLVRRFHMATNKSHPLIYVLTEAGFEVAKQGPNSSGTNYLDPTTKFASDSTEVADPTPADSRFRESEVRSGLYVLHNLHAAGWTLAATRLIGPSAKRVHGGRQSSCAIRPPRGVERPHDIQRRRHDSVGGLQTERFQAIWADARLDIQPPGQPMTHWYIELDRTGRPSKNNRKFLAYDAMFCGWGPLLGAYQQRLPIVVFVCLDERSVLAHLREADTALTGWVAGPVGKEEDRVYHGRRRTWFVAEHDAHEGSLRAWRVPDHPPQARAKLGDPTKMRPVQKVLLPPQMLTPQPPRQRNDSHRPATTAQDAPPS
jgi:hypothetical protein